MPEPLPQPSDTLITNQTPAEPLDGDLRVLALFEQWVLLRDQGQEVPVAELCRDCPHLAARLAEEIALHNCFERPDRVKSGPPPLPVREFAGLRYQPVRFHAQ